MNKSKKSCVSCQHFFFTPGGVNADDKETGWDWSMSCGCDKIEDPWRMSGIHVTQDMLRNTLLIARSCKYYKDIKEEVVAPVVEPEPVEPEPVVEEVVGEVPEVEAVTNA